MRQVIQFWFKWLDQTKDPILVLEFHNKIRIWLTFHLVKSRAEFQNSLVLITQQVHGDFSVLNRFLIKSSFKRKFCHKILFRWYLVSRHDNETIVGDISGPLVCVVAVERIESRLFGCDLLPVFLEVIIFHQNVAWRPW